MFDPFSLRTIATGSVSPCCNSSRARIKLRMSAAPVRSSGLRNTFRLLSAQAVRFADRRTDADFARHVQVDTHPPDDQLLLEVLLSEIRDVRRNDVQQFQDDRRHPLEVPLAKLSFEDLR